MIQAKSLSNVVHLADNPPSSPVVNLESEEPLVLYIARVPGSQDVFLTTTKPLQKVVTAQDVQSSLYYVHVDSEDDDQLRRSSESREPDDAEPTIHVDRTVHKRPVPTIRNVGIEEQFEGPSAAPYHHQGSHHTPCDVLHIARKPVGPRIPVENEDERSRSTPMGTHVMGPRTLHPRLHSDVNPGLGLAQSRESLMPRRWSEQTPTGGPPMPEAAPRFGYAAKSRDPLSRSTYPRRSTESGRFSLTLIRRYDGLQWNVAKILNAYEGESLWQQQPAVRQDDMSIRILTPGYLKFYEPELSETPVDPDKVFERRLSRLRRRSQDQSTYERQADGHGNRKSRMSIDFRRLSKPRLDRNSGTTGSNPSPESKPSVTKGYGFYTPWKSTCEFSSGISGHALKCKHTASTEGSRAITASELRFNLPSSNALAAASPKAIRSPQKPRDTKRSSYFSSQGGDDLPSPQPPIREPHMADGVSDQLDLSLGQEHAGGGFGGKQAKLGKLIIEPEGQKMLDLLVAANMGLWWKVYEKSA
ncbi:MAG: hypothetical protein LQ346_007937 [Caloplaca aetnensis]|nr:MAG: hypothetical protein LQ346_007937 [Caloplaca aetnensis]